MKNAIAREISVKTRLTRLTEYFQPKFPTGLLGDFRHSNPFSSFRGKTYNYTDFESSGANLSIGEMCFNFSSIVYFINNFEY